MRHEPPVRELLSIERPQLKAHFAALDTSDRRLRFGIALNDAGVERYVEHIDFDRDAVFGVADDDLRLLGVAHVARGGGHAELGVSVLSAHRSRGIGGALLSRALMRARNWGVQALFMHCLAENGAMMHLATKQGMEIVARHGEADAWLKLAPADASSLFGEVFKQRVALFDHALKNYVAGWRATLRQ